MKKRNLLTDDQLLELKNTFDGMFRVKAGRGLVNWFARASYVILKSNKPSITRAIVVFLRSSYKLYKKNSMKFLVLYLKTCHVQLMQSVGGYVVADTSLIANVRVSKTTQGLPKMIPRVMRDRIRAGDLSLVRIWLTLFSMYRFLSFRSTVSLKTIVSPGVVITDAFKEEWGRTILWSIPADARMKFRRALDSPKPFLIPKTSPVFRAKVEKTVWWTGETLSTSILGILWAVQFLTSHPILWNKYKDLSMLLYPAASDWISRIEAIKKKIWTTSAVVPKTGPIGGLGFKDEAAGKTRVFAMVDCLTQWLLRPLHKAIFSLLDCFPTDGTHDQMKPIHRLIEAGHTRFWSFDLSAATDRLPVSLQAQILDNLLGVGVGDTWASLLIHRSYTLPRPSKENPRTFDADYGRSVLYAVGQPMGALSSWAMLALTHHLMVACAAKRAGFKYGSFQDYAVLGDDIVIANGKVAREYLNVCKDIGVKVGIHKSLISRNGVLEFAKRFYVRGVDCSPVPLVELGAATRSLTSVLELARKYSLTLPNLVRLLGGGYKVLGSLTKFVREISPRWRHLGILYYSPWGIQPLGVFKWLSLRYLIDIERENYENEPEGFSKVMRSRWEALYKRVDKLRGPLKGFSGTYTKSPCVTVYNSMMGWLKEAGVSPTCSLTGEIYPLIRDIVDPLIFNFRKDLADAETACRSEIYGFGIKENSLILWDQTRHGLAYVRRLSSPNQRLAVEVVSAAHVWLLWRSFPKFPKTVSYPNITASEDVGIRYYKMSYLQSVPSIIDRTEYIRETIRAQVEIYLLSRESADSKALVPVSVIKESLTWEAPVYSVYLPGDFTESGELELVQKWTYRIRNGDYEFYSVWGRKDILLPRAHAQNYGLLS